MSSCPQCGAALRKGRICASCEHGTTATPEESATTEKVDEEPSLSDPAAETDFEMTTLRWKRWRKIGHFIGYGGCLVYALFTINKPGEARFGEAIVIVVVGGTILSFVATVFGAVFEGFVGHFRDVIPFLRPPQDSGSFKTMDDWRTVKRWGRANDDTEDETPDSSATPRTETGIAPFPAMPEAKSTDTQMKDATP